MITAHYVTENNTFYIILDESLTIANVVLPSGEVTVGKTVCNPKDVYDPDFGVKLAVRRACRVGEYSLYASDNEDWRQWITYLRLAWHEWRKMMKEKDIQESPDAM
jgi:hypothetical protein